MDEAKFHEALLKRLDVLIALQLEKPEQEKPTTMSSRVNRLNSYGLAPSEIASIVRKPLNYVTATLSAAKGRQKKGGGSHGV